MTIIDVARELEADGTKAFTRPVNRWAGYGIYQCSGCLVWTDIHEPAWLSMEDLLAIDWEEVGKES